MTWILALLGLSSAIWFATREPSYQGRSLTEWLTECHYASPEEEESHVDPKSAVRAIGSAKVLPRLLKMIETRDSPLRSKLRDWAVAKEIPVLKDLPQAGDTLRLAITGFEVLGTNAAPAIGTLSKLLDDSERAGLALECLAAIGPSAAPVLSTCLTNKNWVLRNMSVLALSSVVEDSEVFIHLIKDRLNDTNDSVRTVAVQTIGNQTNVPETAVPLLAKALRDESRTVISQATAALGRFGTNATSALPALRELAEQDRMKGSSFALRAILMIAPEQALPILLRNIRSPDRYQRSIAVGLLADHPDDDPAITKALEAASLDPDSQVASRATRSLSLRQQRMNPSSTGKIKQRTRPILRAHPLNTHGTATASAAAAVRKSWSAAVSSSTSRSSFSNSNVPDNWQRAAAGLCHSRAPSFRRPLNN